MTASITPHAPESSLAGGDGALEALARQAWHDVHGNRPMISWAEVGEGARAVLCRAVELGMQTSAPMSTNVEPAEKADQSLRRKKVAWEGPLFYPPIGKIAVTDSGSRIEVWPDESEDAGCFTGLMLRSGRTHAERVVFDLSCMWDRRVIDHIEEPTEADRPLLGLADADSEGSHP